MEDRTDKFVLLGLLGSSSLLAFYFVISSALGGVSFALDNFIKLWYWMIPLIVGFGLQIGMFFYVKSEMHKKAGAQAAASTGISAASMVACCAHHISDIAPFLGIAAFAVFFTKYQPILLLAGILSNILGIVYMMTLMETNTSKPKIKKIFYSLLILAVVIVLVSIYFTSNKSETTYINQDRQKFQTLTSNKNNVEFQVTPLSSSEFRIYINTHSVQLDFNPAEISLLYDDSGNKYKPLRWDGSSPGGHHRNGILSFPEINKNAKSIKLVITDTARREFDWNLD